MEQIIFIVIVVVVGLLQMIARAMENRKNAEAEKRGGSPAPPVSAGPQRAPADSEEERIRKFLEALGVPTANEPPPKVQPRDVAPKTPPPKRTYQPIDPFPIPRPARERPAPPVAAEPAPPPVVTAPPPLPAMPLPNTKVSAPRKVAEFELQDAANLLPEDLEIVEASTGQSGRPPAGIAARLATAEGLRDAVVLREIFGPPRSMQPFERQTVG